MIVATAAGGSGNSAEFSYGQRGFAFERVLTIGEGAPATALVCGHEGPPLAVRDSLGRFFVEGCDCDVHVYDASGAYLRSLGHCGEGPGEVQGIRSLAAADHIFIGGVPARVIEYSEDLDVVGQFPLRRTPYQIDLLSSGKLAINHPTGRADQAEVIDLVQIYDRSGERLVSTGSFTLRGYSAELDFLSDAAVAVDPERDVIWVGRKANHYEIAGWSDDGTLIKRLDIAAPWFPDFSGPWKANRPILYPHGMTWAGGYLWVVGQAPADPTAELPSIDRIRSFELLQMLDVIDVSTGEVIARGPVDNFSGWIDELMYAERRTADDRILLDLFRGQLRD